MTRAIEARGLVKEFVVPDVPPGRFSGLRRLVTVRRTTVRAVDDVSLDVEEGECVALLGRNGAGKSTTIKMLTGILSPDAGTVRVAGIDPWRQRRRNAYNIGLVFGQRSQLWYDLPLQRSFEVLRDMYGLKAAEYERVHSELVDVLQLDAFLATPVRALSLGQRMRGEIAAALLHDPAIVFLDEPTIGLDVLAKDRIRRFVLNRKVRAGRTTVLTTHDLGDVEHLCDRVVFFDQGHVMFDGALDAMVREHAPYRDVVVTPEDPADIPQITSPYAIEVLREESTVALRFDSSLVRPRQVIHDVSARFEIRDAHVLDPSVEDVVRHLYLKSDDDALS